MLKYLGERIRKYGFWTALIGMIPLIIRALGLDVDAEHYTDIVTALLAFLVAAGIVSSPQVQSFVEEKEELEEDSADDDDTSME